MSEKSSIISSLVAQMKNGEISKGDLFDQLSRLQRGPGAAVEERQVDDDDDDGGYNDEGLQEKEEQEQRQGGFEDERTPAAPSRRAEMPQPPASSSSSSSSRDFVGSAWATPRSPGNNSRRKTSPTGSDSGRNSGRNSRKQSPSSQAEAMKECTFSHRSRNFPNVRRRAKVRTRRISFKGHSVEG